LLFEAFRTHISRNTTCFNYDVFTGIRNPIWPLISTFIHGETEGVLKVTVSYICYENGNLKMVR